jgi:hypothetical protein
MRSVILFAVLLPSAASAQFAPCEPTDAQEFLDCLNGRIARLETVVGGAGAAPGAAAGPMGGPLVRIAPVRCARWHRDDDGFRCVLFKRAS